VQASVNSAVYADNILTMSSQTHMSTEALQAYKYAAELLDTPLETLTGSMAKQIRSMNSAAGGFKDMAAAYEKLGVKVKDSNGHLKNSEDVYWSKISKVIGTTVGGLTSAIIAELPKIVQAGPEIVMSIVNAITANLSIIISSAVTIVMTLLQGLSLHFHKLHMVLCN